MQRRTSLRLAIGAIGAAVAMMVLAPAASADTCCANLPVQLEPRNALPGDTVRVIGLECRNADNSGSLPLKLGAFWLWSGSRGADAQPDTVPGPGLPSDLPATDQWPPFATVPAAAAGSGEATITVPHLPRGTYQLWWWCDVGAGPGGGIHYSTGPRLAIGSPPDTATAGDAAARRSSPASLDPWLLAAVGTTAFVLAFRWTSRRRSPRDGGRRRLT